MKSPKIKFVAVQRRHLKRLNEIVNDPSVSKYLTLTPPVSMRSTVANTATMCCFRCG